MHAVGRPPRLRRRTVRPRAEGNPHARRLAARGTVQRQRHHGHTQCRAGKRRGARGRAQPGCLGRPAFLLQPKFAHQLLVDQPDRWRCAADLRAWRRAERRLVYPAVRLDAGLALGPSACRQPNTCPGVLSMSATSATLPRRDTAGAGHRPLSAIAAAASGGVPPARILRVLADVAGPLADWHAQGRVHGAVAMSTIGLDSSGRAHLLAPPLAPAADAEGAVRIRGYAAFEQYTDDPERPCGPWTDVYALSAVAHALVVGAPPPDALARCVKDAYVPLQGRDVGAYDAGFLQAIDRGLSMTHGARPADMQACAQAFGFALAQPVPPEPQAAPVEPEPDLPPVAAPPRAAAGPRVPLLVMLGVLAAVALAVYLWLRPGAPGSQSAGRAASPVEPAPEPAPVPAPPALADL